MRFGDITFNSRFPPGQFGSPKVLKNKNVNLYLNFSFATWPFNQVDTESLTEYFVHLYVLVALVRFYNTKGLPNLVCNWQLFYSYILALLF